MNKRYLLISKIEFADFDNVTSQLFYTFQEAEATAYVDNKKGWLTAIIDLKNENIKWQGVE